MSDTVKTGDGKVYDEKPNETRLLISDSAVAHDQHLARIRASFEQMMAKNPKAIVIHGLAENGDVFTSATGSPFDVMHVDEVGFHQLVEMLRRGAEAAERNG